MSDGAVLLFDGDCALCHRTVHFILARERRRWLRFAPLDGEFARAVIARHPALAGVDSVIWVDRPGQGANERALARSDAALRVAAYLGGPWRALVIARIVPRSWRDGLYDFVARHRHRLVRAAGWRSEPRTLPHERLLDDTGRADAD